MGTNLSFQAQNAAVELDDHSITIVRAAPSASSDDGGGSPEPEPIVIPRPDVTGAELKPASLMAYGRLLITTRLGQTHTIEFTRDTQDTFTTLHAIIRP